MCIFCKIVNNEIPSYKIYEDDFFIAILDISQATIGHSLIIAKNHRENILALNEDETQALGTTIKNVTTKIKKNLNVENINILHNIGPLAGQSVFHFHVHIIPRYENDQLIIEFNQNALTQAEFIHLKNKILA